MRLSKIAWLILGIGIFVIAFGILFVGYSRLSGEQETAQKELSAAQALLPQLISEREDWTNQLDQLVDQSLQVDSALNKSMAKFPQAVESIEYDEELIMIAHACDLEIASLTASEPLEKEVEGIIYTITTFKVEVISGYPLPDPLTKAYIDETIANMLTFINAIVTDDYFTTATIEQVNIESPQPEEEGEKPSATITLIIYSYQGEQGE